MLFVGLMVGTSLCLFVYKRSDYRESIDAWDEEPLELHKVSGCLGSVIFGIPCVVFGILALMASFQRSK